MNNFALKYIILVIAQILLLNYLSILQYVMVCLLPTMILCLPISFSTIKSMLIAFVTGMVVDLLCNGSIGVCAAALVPVACFRSGIIALVFGSELYSRKEHISFDRQGWKSIFLAVLILTSIYLIIYVALDSLGTRPVWVDIVKYFASLLISSVVSLYIAGILHSEAKWK